MQAKRIALKNKAIFLDRDGVINDGTLYYTYKIEDFNILPDVVEAIKYAKNNGYIVCVITNQSGIAKGKYSLNDVQKVHEYFMSVLKMADTAVDKIYVCPHHPIISDCNCRKPKPGMLENAIKDFNIDRDKSIMIGDSERDIQAASNAGIKGILIKKNSSILKNIKEIVRENS